MSFSRSGQKIKLSVSSRLGLFPFGSDPRFLFEPVQSWVEGALLHLKHFTRDLLNALGNRPAVFGFEGNRFQDQEVQGALDEIVWLGHTMIIYSEDCRLSRYVGVGRERRKPWLVGTCKQSRGPGACFPGDEAAIDPSQGSPTSDKTQLPPGRGVTDARSSAL